LSRLTHEAVMTEEVLENLVLSKRGLYVDCTFGAGGHSSKILEKLDNHGKLLSMDKDKNATSMLTKEFTKDSRFKIINDSFSKLSLYVENETANGILVDLGISSTQLDDSERGFSFQSDGPLDMRLDTSKGLSAEEWINSASKKEIEEVFWILGEDRFSRRIAKKICDRRIKNPIRTTKELSEIVLSAVTRKSKKHPATNIFRAIRMKINEELEELYKVLEASSYALCFGGRLAVISFHSIEDRVVKRFIQGKDRLNSSVKFSYTGDKFIKPTLEEIKRNPRSRSAILRVAEKVM
tara:strand:+ start:431 stop:1315 length:885 start_codon:yes stop_codon:yes gene_type:complete